MPRPRHSLRATLRRGALVAAAGALSLGALSRVAAAQGPDQALPDPRRAFEDSWHWGVKGGATRFGTLTDGRVIAPNAGAEWLITRSRGALLVSAEQAFFDRASVVADPYAEEGVRAVSIRDARRYSVAALAAPVALGRLRPYVGIGLAMHLIREATPQGDFATMQQLTYVRDRVDAAQSLVAPFLVAGAQAQFGRAALFVQGHATGEHTRSLWNRGGSQQVEAGIRYNVASAFER